MTYYTHSGMFHCDEVAGYSICKFIGLVDDFMRLDNTDPENLPDGGVIADIGRVYDPSRNMFDHHQGMIYREDGYPYATAGLLWKEYGNRFVATYMIFKELSEDFHQYISRIVERVDETLFKGIDASDCDNQYNVQSSCVAGDVRVLTLPVIISKMNSEDPKDYLAQRTMFDRASGFFFEILCQSVHSAIKHVQSVEKFDTICTQQFDDRLLILSEGLGWREIVHDNYSNAEYLIMPSNRPETSHTLFAVSVDPSSRELKNPIERPEWFDGFIHVGKWIAAGSLEQLREIAEFNINK